MILKFIIIILLYCYENNTIAGLRIFLLKYKFPIFLHQFLECNASINFFNAFLQSASNVRRGCYLQWILTIGTTVIKKTIRRFHNNVRRRYVQKDFQHQ